VAQIEAAKKPKQRFLHSKEMPFLDEERGARRSRSVKELSKLRKRQIKEADRK